MTTGRVRPVAPPGAPGGRGGVVADSTGRLPDGFGVSLDRSVRRAAGGTVLIGGSPIRVLRLTPAGRDLVDRLAAGQPVPAAAAAQALTRRLLDAGLAHPRPPAAGEGPAVSVVIPVRDDHQGLAATLAALRNAPTTDPSPAAADGRSTRPRTVAARNGAGRAYPGGVVVVDDLSAEPAVVAAVCAEVGARLIRRAVWGGPGAARNDGWRATAERFVAFVDANCEPEPGWLDRLLPHFADPRVGAVAPRIVPGTNRAGSAVLAAYEAVASPLDLGAEEALVRPRSRVAYVPTAALVVRRTALVDVGGFDETLVVGEDVDLVWRLVAAGWTVRYEPGASVRHPARPTWPAWLRQRYRYGTSAAGLARRHGPAVAPAVVSPWTAAGWALVAAGQPLAAAATAGLSLAAPAVRLARRPAADGERTPRSVRLPVSEAVRLAGIGHLRGGLGLARAVRRAWAPAAVLVALTSRRSRPALAAAALVPGVVDWIGGRPRLDPVRYVALGLADDVAYAAGVWAGCARERSTRALWPDVRSASRPPVRHTEQPPSGSIGGRR